MHLIWEFQFGASVRGFAALLWDPSVCWWIMQCTSAVESNRKFLFNNFFSSRPV